MVAIGEVHTGDRTTRIKRTHAVKQVGTRRRATTHRTGSGAAAPPPHAIDHRAEALGPGCRRDLRPQRHLANEPRPHK